MTSLADVIKQVGVTRLTHFTPAKNLFHILQDEVLRSSQDLANRAPDFFAPTDRERLDSHPEMLCCSLQYPNGYYLSKARQKPDFQNYPDWVCLLLDAQLLERPGSLFCPCNAARGWGAHLQPGAEGLLRCFESPSPVQGYLRQPLHTQGVPTDLQAEALIPGPVGLEHVLGIVVPSLEAAVHEAGRLKVLSQAVPVPWYVSETFFNRDGLRRALHNGLPVEEIFWDGDV